MIPFYEVQQNDINVSNLHRELFFPEHMHSHMELIYVIRNKQKLCINKNMYEINEGEAAIIFPDILHYYTRDKKIKKNNKSSDSIIVTFNLNIFGGMFSGLHNYYAENPVIPINKINIYVKDAFINISKNTKENDAICGWICLILNYLLKEINIKKNDSKKDKNVVELVLSYIQKHFTENIKLSIMAKELHINEYYISHVFNNNIKINLRSYLGMLRAEYAAKLIRTTNNNMTEISGIVGFNSIRTFNRVFVKIYGVTPSQYKKNITEYLKKQK